MPDLYLTHSPAHAGIDPGSKNSSQTGLTFPRARGDRPVRPAPPLCDCGIPPRARIDRWFLTKLAEKMTFPRARADRPIGSSSGRCAATLPPRARIDLNGNVTPHFQPHSPAQAGIDREYPASTSPPLHSPAHAGINPCLRSTSWTRSPFPRARRDRPEDQGQRRAHQHIPRARWDGPVSMRT